MRCKKCGCRIPPCSARIKANGDIVCIGCFDDNEEYLINYCKRDNVWLVQRKTARKSYMYITIAECFTAEAAEILRTALITNLNKKQNGI